jgi:predicted HD superfamily hydrolase involved in NAD metabolism
VICTARGWPLFVRCWDRRKLTYLQLARRVRAFLDQDHRYRHVVRVARAADVLAQRHGADPAKARIAGLLHDLARLYSTHELIAECERRSIPIDDFARAHPVVLHAPLGAALAEELFGVSDPQILSAIEKHTLGDARMSDLDSIVYLADGLEPGRDFPERAALWNLALRDLRAAVDATIVNSIDHLERTGGEVAPRTLAALRARRHSEGSTPSLT